MTSCLYSVCINYPSRAAITPDAARYLWRNESPSGPSLKGNVIEMESLFHAWQGSAVSKLIPLHQFHLKFGNGLTDLDF